jgi:hypothetical protein
VGCGGVRLLAWVAVSVAAFGQAGRETGHDWLGSLPGPALFRNEGYPTEDDRRLCQMPGNGYQNYRKLRQPD